MRLPSAEHVKSPLARVLKKDSSNKTVRYFIYRIVTLVLYRYDREFASYNVPPIKLTTDPG